VDAAGMISGALYRAKFRCRLFPETAHDKDSLGMVEGSLNFVPMRQPIRTAPLRGASRLSKAAASRPHSEGAAGADMLFNVRGGAISEMLVP